MTGTLRELLEFTKRTGRTIIIKKGKLIGFRKKCKTEKHSGTFGF